MNLAHSISILLFLFISNLSIAQERLKPIKQRFRAGVQIGITTSQIDGDNFAGFDKRGIQGGLFTQAILNHQTSIIAELYYTPRGSRIESRKGSTIKNRIIHLDYMEVPILIKHLFHLKASSTFIEGGFSYSRLINIRIKEPSRQSQEASFRALSEEFKSNEISFILGLGRQFTKQLSFKFRSSFAVTPFYRREIEELLPSTNPPDPNVIKVLRSYQLSILAGYTF